jgi:hypothetical protein
VGIGKRSLAGIFFSGAFPAIGILKEEDSLLKSETISSLKKSQKCKRRKWPHPLVPQPVKVLQTRMGRPSLLMEITSLKWATKRSEREKHRLFEFINQIHFLFK